MLGSSCVYELWDGGDLALAVGMVSTVSAQCAGHSNRIEGHGFWTRSGMAHYKKYAFLIRNFKLFA